MALPSGVLFLDKGGIIHPVAALGNANDWPLLRSDAFKALLPAASDLTSTDPAKATLFSWSDLNENGKVDPDELHFVKSTTGAVTIISGSLKGASQGSKTAPGPPDAECLCRRESNALRARKAYPFRGSRI